jgi:hypothetical protein
MPGLLVSREWSASEYCLLLFTDSSMTLVHRHTINAIRFSSGHSKYILSFRQMFEWVANEIPSRRLRYSKKFRMAGEAYKYRL